MKELDFVRHVSFMQHFLRKIDADHINTKYAAEIWYNTA